MKVILYIHCNADLYGSSRCMLNKVRQQKKDGYKVVVILPFEGKLKPELKKVGASVHVIPYEPTLRKKYFSHPIRFIKFIFDVVLSIAAYLKIAKLYKADFIYTNASVIVPGGLVARILKIPHICHVRESYQGFGLFWNIYRKYLINFANLVVCASNSMAKQFNYDKLMNKKICVIYDDIFLNDFNPASRERILRFKEQFHLNGYMLVGLVGRIILQRKGQDVFVRAAKLLKEKHTNIRFLIVGSPYQGNEFHLYNLFDLIDELAVNNYVIYTGEAYDIQAIYSALDISVMASATPEPFAGVVLESMLYRVPVVGTNIGGTPEQIIDGKTGILVAPNDPVSMASAIERLLLNKQLRKDMGYAGYQRVQEFTFPKFYNLLMEKLSSLA